MNTSEIPISLSEQKLYGAPIVRSFLFSLYRTLFSWFESVAKNFFFLRFINTNKQYKSFLKCQVFNRQSFSAWSFLGKTERPCRYLQWRTDPRKAGVRCREVGSGAADAHGKVRTWAVCSQLCDHSAAQPPNNPWGVFQLKILKSR